MRFQAFLIELWAPKKCVILIGRPCISLIHVLEKIRSSLQVYPFTQTFLPLFSCAEFTKHITADMDQTLHCTVAGALTGIMKLSIFPLFVTTLNPYNSS